MTAKKLAQMARLRRFAPKALRMIEEMKRGDRPIDVAKRHGVHRSRASFVGVIALGRRLKTPYTEEEKSRLLQLHAEGLTDREIAAKMQRHSGWVGHVRRSLGKESNGSVPASLQGTRDPALVEQVMRLCSEGLSFSQIGAMLSISRGKVAGITRDVRKRARNASRMG